MQFKKWITAAAAGAALLTTGSVWADRLQDIKKAGVLRVGAQVAQVPWGFSDKSGKLTGYDIEFAELLAKDLGVKPEFTPRSLASSSANSMS